ncbi:hypothetical protein CDAR_234111 [Caerostris darwini]|uniref:Uncharacterized protein n=1 Tax=Caerostris darwini TaxID=1538125 RepID=A0AAV4QNE6_9ARAC|nr:hypothetical protein CDAR_234111 [Caerostris darwini]
MTKGNQEGGLGMFVEPPFQNTNLTVPQHLCGLTPGNVCGEIVADQRLEEECHSWGLQHLKEHQRGLRISSRGAEEYAKGPLTELKAALRYHSFSDPNSLEQGCKRDYEHPYEKL